MQTSLNSDAFCIYNQASAPLEWTLQKGQYNNTFAYGTVGVNASANFVRPDVINIDSFLSGRDDILSKCNPPIPALEDSNMPPLTYQNQGNITDLQPLYTKEKNSAINLSALTYLPFTMNPHLPVYAQDVNHIVFEGAAQRGGADTRAAVKSSWNEDQCTSFLDPQHACGVECSEASGYTVRMPHSKRGGGEAVWAPLPKGPPSALWYVPGKSQVPKARPRDITSRFAVSIGAAPSGPQYTVPTYEPVPNIWNPNDRFPKVRENGVSYSNSPLYNLMAH